MNLMVRAIAPADHLEDHVALEAVSRILPPRVITAVLAQHGVREQRRRKLPAPLVVLVCIAMHLFASEALPGVFRRLVGGLRWCWPVPQQLTVTKGALCQARARLGVPVLVTLFHAVCQPLATPATPGAFYHGLRLLAVDGTKLDVPDTAANARAFGRTGTARGRSAFPQVLVVGLCECASHALLDAGVWRVDANEHAAAQRLLRALTTRCLLLYDAGLHSVALVAKLCQREAEFLGRLPGHVHPCVLCPLPDGTQLVRLRPRHRAPDRVDQPLRLLRYTLDDPQRPGHQREHRLLTSLLDPQQYPAEELIILYHQRWEFELILAEVVTHQRPRRPLRSQTPLGVLQECYALFLAHYVIRTVMAAAAATADLAPTQLSFLESLRLIRQALPDFQRFAPRHHATIYRRLLADIVATRLPARATRGNPRVVKRQQSPFPVKRPQHCHPPPPKPFRDAIVLLN